MDIPEGLTLPSPSGRKRSGASISLGIGRGEKLKLLTTVALRVEPEFTRETWIKNSAFTNWQRMTMPSPISSF